MLAAVAEVTNSELAERLQRIEQMVLDLYAMAKDAQRFLDNPAMRFLRSKKQ